MYVAWFICIYFDIWINLKMLQIIKFFFCDRIHHPPDVSHHPDFSMHNKSHLLRQASDALLALYHPYQKWNFQKKLGRWIETWWNMCFFLQVQNVDLIHDATLFQTKRHCFCCCKGFVLIPFVKCAAMDFLGFQWQLAISVYITSVKPRHGRSTPRSMSLTLKCFTKSEGKKRMDGWCCKSWKSKMIWPKPQVDRCFDIFI